MTDNRGAAADPAAEDLSERFDYIIVGAGSAGCMAAAQLAEDAGLRVLVLEAGDPAEAHPETALADGYRHAFINDRLMYDRVSEPQVHCDGLRCFLGSGRGVGGSGSVNAMVYTRGDRADYAAWGVPGWSYDEIEPDFQAIEAQLRPTRHPPTPFLERCISAAATVGLRRKEDLNDGALGGHLGYEWMNMRDGLRRSAYVASLRPRLALDGGGVTLRSEAQVQRLLLESSSDGALQVLGVEYLRGNQRRRALCDREVLLCAGALESPRLLLLSGLGPADELRALGIPVRRDMPGVGRNLQDHPNVALFFRAPAEIDFKYPQLYGFHRVGRGTDLVGDAPDTCFVFYSARSSFREGVMRLLPLMLLPLWLYRVALLRQAVRSLVALVFLLPFVDRLVRHLYGIVVILGKPRSRGRLRLRSADPQEPPAIDPNYLSEPEDQETLVSAVSLARQLAGAPPLADSREVLPGARVRGAKRLSRFVRRSLITTYHYGGTCRMGVDPDSVVDAELRVRGVRGLRVADASIMPTVPVCALNATAMVIGHRAGRLCLRDLAAEREVARASPGAGV